MTVYKIGSERRTFFVLDDNANGRLDRQEVVFLDADNNQTLTDSDISVSQTVLTEALTPYGVRSVRRLPLTGLAKYTALFREFRQCEAEDLLVSYWQLYAELALAGMEVGLSKKTLGSVLPSVAILREDYRAALVAALAKVEKAILSGASELSIQSAISSILKMMEEAEASRLTFGLSQPLFSSGDVQFIYQKIFEIYQRRAASLRLELLGLNAARSFQTEGLAAADSKALRQTAYAVETEQIAVYLLSRYWEAFFWSLSKNPKQAVPDDLQTLLLPLATVIIKEFIVDGEWEAATLTWRAYVTSPLFDADDFSAEGKQIQKALAEAAIAALKMGDQETHLACLTLLREPLEGLLPEAQTQPLFAKIAFYQSVLEADQAGLSYFTQTLAVDESAPWLLSLEEASELIAFVQQPGIKAQLGMIFPELQKKPVSETRLPRKKFGMTVEE